MPKKIRTAADIPKNMSAAQERNFFDSHDLSDLARNQPSNILKGK